MFTLKAPEFILKYLEFPQLYMALQKVLGAVKSREVCLMEYGDIQEGHRVLDVGCGPGYALNLLPKIDYLGFDVEKKYIEYAQKQYGDRGEFRCEFLSAEVLAQQGKFDRIILMGVLHHLSDEDYQQYFEMLKSALNPNGKLITLDGVYDPKQSWLAKTMLDNDRGKYVRDLKGYMDIAQSYFPEVHHVIREDIFRIPYTTLIMICEPEK